MNQTFAPARASVLVVDDVAENRDLLVRRLKRLGIDDIEQAVNGIEALAAIERKTFHLVLLDIMMPELDGFGVLARLKGATAGSTTCRSSSSPP
jgi:sigma-B regulation protein RsbU (phosphoserine phosphatase)